MNMARRIDNLERRMQGGTKQRALVVWDERTEAPWRERAEEARARGWMLTIITIGVALEADTVEEAEVIVARHRDRRVAKVTVTRRGTDAQEVLAEWRKELPEWLAWAGAAG